MPSITSSLVTFPPDDMPIWARLRLIAARVRFEEVTHWQPTCEGVIYAFTRTRGLLVLARTAS